jgi:hypothetical protein
MNPTERYKQLKRVILEWVVTNGSLPGFEERMSSTKPLWKFVGPGGLMVYRGQGHSIPGIPSRADPATLVTGVRPILATSKSRDVATRYMGKDCCLFEIQLQPGIRYIDAKVLFTFTDRVTGKSITNVSNETIDSLLGLAAPMNDEYWLKKAIASGNGRNVVRAMFLKRLSEEDEILVDSTQGGFTVTPRTFKATYALRGRGRTFRTNTLRRSKNGYRPPRKSQNRRDRKSRHRRHPDPDV